MRVKKEVMTYGEMQHDVILARKQGKCVNLSAELTPLCNFNCPMCYIKDRGDVKLLKTEEWISLLDEAIDEGVKYVLLTGGEVLSYPGFYDIVKHLTRRNIGVRIKTNGFYLNSYFLDFISEYPIYLCDISIYGYDRQSYYRNTQIDCFDTICKNINALINSGKTKVRLMITNTKDNALNATKLMTFVKSFSCDVIVNETPLFPPRSRSEYRYENYFVSYDETKMLKKTYCDVFNKEFTQKERNEKSTIEEIGLSCSAGKSSCAIHWNGVVAPCLNFPFDEKEEAIRLNFKEAFSSLNKVVETYHRPLKCMDCDSRDICNYCPAYSMDNKKIYDVFCQFWKDARGI